MANWKEYKLDEIAEILNNKRVPLSTQVRSKRQGKYPYYGASGIVDHIDDYIFEGEHVLISEDGENLRTRNTPVAFKASGKFWVNNHSHIIKGKKPFLNDWIVYYFQNIDINSYLTGAVQPKLNKENLLSIPIRLPDFKTAEIITEILTSLDDKIKLNKQINQQLEAIAQALFKQWFIDFEFPNEEGKPYKSSGGKMVGSELGEIPKGWRSGSLVSIASISKDSIKPFEYPDTLFQHYSIPSFDESKLPGIEAGETILSSKFKVYRNSVLVSKLNPRFPRVWYVGECKEDSICSTEFQVIKPTSSNYFEFVYSLCRSTTFTESLISKASGTSGSHQRVRPNDMLDSPIVIPTLDLIEIFHKTTKELLYSTQANIEESFELKKLRDTLLPKLMSGELQVSEVQTEKPL